MEVILQVIDRNLGTFDGIVFFQERDVVNRDRIGKTDPILGFVCDLRKSQSALEVISRALLSNTL